MATSAFNKFHIFTEDLVKGVHDLTTSVTGELKIALSNTQPVVGDAVLIDIAQIAYTNVRTASGDDTASRVVGNPTITNTSGATKVVLPDMTIEAINGPIPTWQFAVLYNNTPAGGPLIGWMDYAAPVNLALGEKLVIDFEDTLGLFTVT
jgi:hypothetical protein